MAAAVETLYVISVAAELAGMHPQTLRQYDRIGLVIPRRTKGRGRRYTAEDIAELREVQRLSQEEGINLAGIKRVLELQRAATRLAAENQRLQERLNIYERGRGRVFSAAPTGEVAPLTRFPGSRRVPGQELVPYLPGQIVIWGQN
ncbi:heat shock protein transcriptional repressor HspR [Varibaculum vaginae]|uniref:heat shock protein transcriptional repressor HspR n=1 Tax=Varibaculum vaginae TaxID=2364797 RepID=UPI000F087758|nr:helix-turn-helix transcriptional regulator [Varibaculum vaginae]